jgi:DnaJ like chaperone protein
MTSNEQNEGCGCGCLLLGVVISAMTGTWIPLVIFFGLALLGSATPSVSGSRKKYSAENSVEIVEAVFAAAGYVEAGEGQIPPQSVQQAQAYASRLCSGNPDAANEFMRVFMSGESEYQSRLSNVLGFMRRDSRMRYFLLNMISDIATADLNISQSELRRFIEVAGILGVGAEEAQEILKSNLQFKAFSSSFNNGFGGGSSYSSGGSSGSSYSGSGRSYSSGSSGGSSYSGSSYGGGSSYRRREETDNEKAASGRLDLQRAYEILHVSSSDDERTIKKAYRREANKHHPDKLRARGLPESMIKAETEKFELCNAAWEVIKQARGIR